MLEFRDVNCGVETFMHQHQTETICEWICCYGDPNNTTQVHVKFPWLINSRYTLAIYDLVSMNKVSVLLLDSSCESHWMGGKKMSEPYQSLYFGMFPICSFRGKNVLELRKVKKSQGLTNIFTTMSSHWKKLLSSSKECRIAFLRFFLMVIDL